MCTYVEFANRRWRDDFQCRESLSVTQIEEMKIAIVVCNIERSSGPRVSESVVLLLHRVEFDVRYFR